MLATNDSQLKDFLKYLIQYATDLQKNRDLEEKDFRLLELELKNFQEKINEDASLLPSLKEEINSIVLFKEGNPNKSKITRIFERSLRPSMSNIWLWRKWQEMHNCDKLEILNNFKDQLCKILIKIDSDNIFNKIDYQ